MLLLEAHGVKKYFGTRKVLDIPDLQFYTGDKVGLLGRNGVGKTTLLEILITQQQPDEGVVSLYGSYAYLRQLEVSTTEPHPSCGKEWIEEMTLRESMSGGEKTRYKLAQLFSQDAHFLVVDEPTTNLDMSGISKLEEELESFQGGLLVVSHDRQLLDRLCTQIWELEAASLRCYQGNYGAYVEQRRLRRQSEQAEYEKYVKEKRHLQSAILDRQGKATTMKKAPSRMGNSEARLHKRAAQGKKAKLERTAKALESRLQHLEPRNKPRDSKMVNIDIQPPSPASSDFILRVDKLSKDFPRKTLFRDVSFAVRRGEKVAMIGNNGTGKTTLLNMIRQEKPGIELSANASIGYFGQEFEILDPACTVLENVLQSAAYPESLVRLILARLLFRGDDVYKKVALLSGGEKVKCGFAKVFLQDVNLLILDEPTNYLDIDSMEALSEVLQKYAGTVLMVSHDRRFIDQVADHILALENNALTSFTGNYSEYINWKSQKKITQSEEYTELILLENRLAELTGRLALPHRDDDIVQLDKEFKEVARTVRSLKERLR